MVRGDFLQDGERERREVVVARQAKKVTWADGWSEPEDTGRKKKRQKVPMVDGWQAPTSVSSARQEGAVRELCRGTPSVHASLRDYTLEVPHAGVLTGVPRLAKRFMRLHSVGLQQTYDCGKSGKGQKNSH